MKLSKRKLLAIIDALTFTLAGEWEPESHDVNGDYDGALDWALEECRKRKISLIEENARSARK